MKKQTKKFALLVTIAAPMIACANVAFTSCANVVQFTTEHILSFNDLHGADVGYGDGKYSGTVSAKNPGAERIANFINDFQQKNPYTVLLSAGDNASDDAFGSATHGEYVFKINKALGVKYSALGNHAWEWAGADGQDMIKQYEEWGKTDSTQGHYFVNANVLSDPSLQTKEWKYHPGQSGFEEDYAIWNDNRLKTVDPYKIINIHGHSICLIGLTTVGAKSDGNQDFVKDLSFIDYTAAVNYAKHLAKQELQEEYDEIESFVLLTHIESYFDEEYKTVEETGAGELAKNIDTDVDAIISAHSHKEGCGFLHNEKLNKQIWVGQAMTAGRRLLDTQLTFDNRKPVGQQLVDVKMDILKPEIEYGGYNPDDNPREAFDAANKELGRIRMKAKQFGDDNILKKTVDTFKICENDIMEVFDEPACSTETTGEKYPFSAAREILGHSYVWPSNKPTDENYGEPNMKDLNKNYLVEEIGGWIHYHMLNGFRQPAGITEPLIAPSISFCYFDTLTGQIVVPPTADSKVVKKGNLYEIMSHDDKIIYGMMTLGQLCNVIDYILAGEDSFVYGKENNHEYISDTNRLSEDKVQNGLSYDQLTGEKCIRADADISCTESVYLAGPMQFWGMKFEVEKFEVPFGNKNDGKYTRRFRLKRDDNNNPLVYIYDATDSEQQLDKPDTWKQWDSKKLIPFIVNGFSYTGGNGQACMLKPYAEYCQASKGGIIYEYTDLTRDWVANSLQNDPTGVDAPKDGVHSLVTFSDASW